MNTSISTLKQKTFTREYDYIWQELINTINEKKIPIFAIIDHQKNAKDVSLEMPKTRVIIFGNPLIGTNLMLNAPNIALELPLKFLIREEKKQTTILWHDPLLLANQYNATKEGINIAEKMSILLQQIINSIQEK